jgi:hypothetical protein
MFMRFSYFIQVKEFMKCLQAKDGHCLAHELFIVI